MLWRLRGRGCGAPAWNHPRRQLPVGFDDHTLIGTRTRVVYLWDPAPDDRLPEEVGWFLGAIEFVREARRDWAAKVLVHCTGGVAWGPPPGHSVLSSAGSEGLAR